MKLKLEKVAFILLAVVLLFTGVNVLGVESGIPFHHPGVRWRVVMPGETWLRSTVGNHAVLGSIRQGATIASFHGLTNTFIIDGWTWLGGWVSGTGAQMNGMREDLYLVATSQLTIDNPSGAICNINGNGTVVRHTPGGANQGMIHNGATFLPSGFGTRNAGGFTWHLGMIRGSAAGHNGWHGRLMWVATTRLPSGNHCQGTPAW